MKKMMMPAASAVAMALAAPAAVCAMPRMEIDAGKLEKLLNEVKSELDRVGSDVKKTAEEALKQAKDTASVSAETKDEADRLLRAQNDLNGALKKLEGKLEAYETRATDLEQALAERRGGGVGARKLADVLNEHEGLKAFRENGARGTIKVDVKAAVTSAGSSAGSLIWSDREDEIVELPRRRMTIRQLISVGSTSSNAIDYVKQLARTNNAAVVSEGAQKPESNYTFEPATANVRTIAHWVHVSRQALDDARQLETLLRSEMRYGLEYAEELEILKGDGTGEHLPGLVTEATAYSAPIALSGETMIDTLRLAMLQVALAEYVADGAVLHPSDWARIELMKDGENRYLWANPRGMATPSLWGKPIVETQAMDEDEFLVGSFKMAATLYDRMEPEVLISSEDRDNFIKNMLTMRAEERVALEVKRPASLVTGDFGNVSG